MIEILNYEPVQKNKTIGYVDARVRITKPTVLIVRRIAHLDNGERKWFNLPKFTKTNEDESKNFINYSEFERNEDNKALLAALGPLVTDYINIYGIQHQ